MFPSNQNKLPIVPESIQDNEVSIDQSTVVIPVIEEQLQVSTEWVETGRVLVSKHVHEETQLLDVPVTREVVDVQRIPINRVVDEVPKSRQEGNTLILPVVREEVITSIRLVLVEEVHITRHQKQEIDHQSVTTRHETISVQRADSAKP